MTSENGRGNCIFANIYETRGRFLQYSSTEHFLKITFNIRNINFRQFLIEKNCEDEKEKKYIFNSAAMSSTKSILFPFSELN